MHTARCPSLVLSPRVCAARPRSGVRVAASAEAPAAWKVAKPEQVNSLVNDKGYVFLDIRTGKEYRSGNKLHWLHLPLAEELDGKPILNPKFKETFDKMFKNKMSRVIIACDDGGARSEKAAEMVTALGYNAIYTIDGGIDAYLAVSPLTDKDKKARVARVEQFVGIKYGGTGVTNKDNPDDSA